jgi:predicted metal-binding membrane protein
MLLISAAAWLALVMMEPGGMASPALCAAAMAAPPPSGPLHSLPAPSTIASLAMGWALMLAAMMVPLLTAPVSHVRDRSFARRRGRAIALFAGGYAASWMAAGAMLLALAPAVRWVAPRSPTPLALAVFVALIWQLSPIKQRCLNRCHDQPELPAFGLAADLAAFRFGLTHGLWCVGSCWVLMLLPLLVSRGHLAAMAAVTFWILAERLDRAMPPRWRWHGPAKAARIAVAQARMRLPRRAGLGAGIRAR